MHSFFNEVRAIEWIQAQKNLAKIAGHKPSIPLLTREAVKKQGITFEPDVKRLAKKLSSRLREIRTEKERNEKAHQEGVRRIAERISP